MNSILNFTLNVKTVTAIKQLAEYNQWIVWKYENSTKPPYDIKTGKKATKWTSNPNKWIDYETALLEVNNYDGLGFVFTDKDNFCGIDLDDCLTETGELTEFAQNILCKIKSYTEISPSGKGLKIFCKCSQSFKAIKNNKIEIYYSQRYFTVTSNHLERSPETINDCTEEILELLKEHQKADKEVSFNIKNPDKVTDSRTIYIRNLQAYANAALNNELSKLSRAIPNKNRNTLLNESAFNLGQLISSDLLDKNEIASKLYQVSLTIGLEKEEIKSTIQSGLKAGMSKPRKIVKTEYDFSELPFFNFSKKISFYFYLRSYINRDNGWRKDIDNKLYQIPVWANLDYYFKEGYLATARHQSSYGRIFNKNQSSISRWISEYLDIGYIKKLETINIVMYDGQIQPIDILALGTHYINDNEEIVENFYLDFNKLNEI